MNKRIPILFGLILVIVAMWVLVLPTRTINSFLLRLDHLGYDLQLRTRVLTENKKPQSPIAIIDIDDKSIQAEGRWPWPRGKMAELVTELQKQGAAVIAFDIFFSEPEGNIAEQLSNTLSENNLLDSNTALTLKNHAELFDEDSKFAKSLAASPTVLALGFLPRKITQNTLPPPLLMLDNKQQNDLDIYATQGYISNISLLQDAAKVGGFINIFPDSDGIIRHVPMVLTYKNGVYPSLALQAVMTFLDEKASLVTPSYGDEIEMEGIKVGATTIPTDSRGQANIPFIGKSYTFDYYSATDALHGKLAKNALAGKILFVGTSATGLGDLQATAIQNPFPGVEIQATVAEGILQNNFSYKPAWTFGANVVLTLLFGLIAAFVFPYFGPRVLALLIFVLPVLMLFINNWFWQKTGLILSLIVPVIMVLLIALMNIIYGYLFESRRREQLKEIFGQYVPAKHIDEMLKTRGSYAMRGEDREMSVLFADIRSFTTISEGMSAKDLVEMLNIYFTPMTEIIFSHQGTIDKYVGDLIMAFWGAPLSDKNHARHALESALEMNQKLKMLDEEFKQHGWAPFRIGIGLNSGSMSVGDMGSRYRRNYTVLGDEVNLASRVESLTKFYGVDIIATENTVKDQTRFVFKKLDKVRVKGKNKGVDIYEVVCTQMQLTPDLKNEIDAYHQALDSYLKQNWDAALESFTQLHKHHPDQKIYELYIHRIDEFKQHPPAKDWDGVFTHAEK